ncbi:MAG: hypothetical protein KBG04_07940 [Bacteroidales bacterium]|nr:hypothetical protein [Bacteroidales bacterium]
MEKIKDYAKEITEIRSMMERSSKFMLLSGWAGIIAGLIAIAGTFSAFKFLHFVPTTIFYEASTNVLWLALAVLTIALTVAVYCSYSKAVKRGEKLWNPTTRRMLFSLSVPLITGALIIIILIINGLNGLIAPFTLIFYGLALFGGGYHTLPEVKVLGLVEILLGILALFIIKYSLIFWATGFGLSHIIYGIYIHLKYEK